MVCGFFDSIDAAADKLGYELHDVFNQTIRLAHGTTVSTNMVVEDGGATTGLITTAGQEDTVRMMRGRGRVTGGAESGQRSLMLTSFWDTSIQTHRSAIRSH